jgi:DAK2 domain fusion protein YloV
VDPTWPDRTRLHGVAEQPLDAISAASCPPPGTDLDDYAVTVPILDRLDVRSLRAVMTSFCDVVQAHAPVLNLLNVYPVPDGDTGTNMARTLQAVVAEMDSAGEDLAATCHAISHGSLMGARGNSGVILSQILRGLATTLEVDDPLESAGATGQRVADALVAASAGAYQAVLTPVEGTILTVVRESSEAARAVAAAGASLLEVLEVAHRAAAAALERTPELLPALRDAGVVDAGGAGFLLLFDAALHVVADRPLPVPDLAGTPEPRINHVPARDLGGDQRYEVMYLCDLADELIEQFKQQWGTIGDSIVVVGGDGLWNCHVHTNDIGAAVETALDLDGRPRQIRVTDLIDEVQAEQVHRESVLHPARGTQLHANPPAKLHTNLPAEVQRCAVVAVSSGDGLSQLFVELGVQTIVAGGQTANPSTSELLAAVERCVAEEVIILPNNHNILPVAEQVAALTEIKVRVVPTRSMPEGLAALVVHDPGATAQHNVDQMNSAIATLATGEVTRAVRSSASQAGQISEGDWIGLVRGEGIVVVASTLREAAVGVLGRLVTTRTEIVTVLSGAEADDSVTEALLGWMAEGHADVEVEVHRGGQPLYPYLFGVE